MRVLPVGARRVILRIAGHEGRDMEWLAKLFEKYPEKGVYVTLGIGYLILLILCEYVATKIAH